MTHNFSMCQTVSHSRRPSIFVSVTAKLIVILSFFVDKKTSKSCVVPTLARNKDGRT